jgi:hypothetical protein
MGTLKDNFEMAGSAVVPLEIQNSATCGHGVSANGFGITPIVKI